MTFKFLFDSTSTKRKPILFKEYRLTQEFNMKAKKYYFFRNIILKWIRNIYLIKLLQLVILPSKNYDLT